MFAYFVTLPVLYAFSFVVPFYKTFKAIEKLTLGCPASSTFAEGSSGSDSSASSVSKDSVAEARRWLVYWIFAGVSQQLFHAYESRANATSFVYYLIKVCWYVVLSNPKYGNVAEMIYAHAVTPTLGAHQDNIDKFVSEKCCLISNHTSCVVNQIKNRAAASTAAPMGGAKPSRLATPPKKSH